MTTQGPSSAAPLSAADDRQWASFAHFGNIILVVPALIIYLVFKDRGNLVRQESKEALNWTINVTGLAVVVSIVNSILSFIPIIGWVMGLILTALLWAVLIVNLIFAIMGGVKVSGGGSYRYPVNIRWIK
ncbi:MAG: hypothetical protein JWP30_1352 [Homoserinimonas sp.]|nr:hypothetical protein [Homoserinimonas sp.]